VAHLTTIMMGVVNGTAETLGVKMDPDRPLREAVLNQQPCD
jgi:hypothetical protein